MESSLLTPKLEICDNVTDASGSNKNCLDSATSMNPNSTNSTPSTYESTTAVTVDTTNVGRNDMKNKLKEELERVKSQISEQNSQLAQAQQTIAEQNKELMQRFKFVMESEQYKLSMEAQNKLATEMKTSLLKSTVNEIEKEKLLRSEAEMKIEKLKGSIKSLNHDITNIIWATNRNGETQAFAEFSMKRSVSEDRMRSLSSLVQMRVDKLLQSQTERRRELKDKNVMIEQLMTVIGQQLQKNVSLTDTDPAAMIGSSAASAARKRKRSGSVEIQLSKKRQLIPLPNDSNCNNEIDFNNSHSTNAHICQREELTLSGHQILERGYSEDMRSTISIGTTPIVEAACDSMHDHSSTCSAPPTIIGHGVDPSDPSCLRCICGLKSRTKYSLNIHVKRYTVTPKFYCGQCNHKYVFASELKKHYKSIHNVDWKYSIGCILCGQYLKNKGELLAHHRRVHPNGGSSSKTTSCEQAPNTGDNGPVELSPPPPSSLTTTEPQLNSHRMDKEILKPVERHSRDLSTSRNQFHCLCGRKYTHHGGLFHHMQTSNSPRKMFKCVKCSKMFRRGSDMRKHLLLLHKVSVTSKEFGCFYCGRMFPSMFDLRAHKKLNHATPNSNLDVNLCANDAFFLEKNSTIMLNTAQDKLETPKQTNLEQHSSTGPPSLSKNKPDHEKDTTFKSSSGQCRCICGKIYREYSSLLHHIKVLVAEPKFQCNKCTMRFVMYCHFKMHCLKSHNITLRSSAGCEKCGNTFLSRGALNNHLKTMHPLTSLATLDESHSTALSSTDNET